MASSANEEQKKEYPDKGTVTRGDSSGVVNGLATRLEELAGLPHRNAGLHWIAFLLSIVALVILAVWIAGNRDTVPTGWLALDIGLSVFFAIEFFTRSGFRWNPAGYIRSRFFDFVAIVPALVLVHYSVVYLTVWLWIILAARIIRVLDRLLGDGFFRRNSLALVEGFEEEITDRVLLRIISRIQNDLDHGRFGEKVSETLVRNKEPLLNRLRSEHPHQGIAGELAQFVGLSKVLEKVEERTFDSIVEILKSAEVDRTIRGTVDSAFSSMRQQIGVKSWRKHLGIRRKRAP
jgi:hypothetical protein